MRGPKPSDRSSGRRIPGRFGWSAGRGVRRFVVQEQSMLPRLQPGDGVVAVRCRRARADQIRVFEHPGRPGFWLVKRVGRVDGDRFEAVSDNDAVPAVDSRTFGPVPTSGSYRVVVRIPARWLAPGHRSSDTA